jgi:hypothetical protein
VFLLAAGGAARLVETMRIVLSSPATNTYAIRFGSGPWFRPVVDFLLFRRCRLSSRSRGIGACSCAGAPGTYDRTGAFFFLLAALLVLELSSFTKNIRYAIVLELPLRFFAVGFVAELAGGLRARRSSALAFAAVLAMCWLDWRTFDAMWVQAKLYDPVTAWLAYLRHLVPMNRGP